MTNYIPTANPYGLATPPDWFLRELAAYDRLMVIFPSICEPVYRLARRTSQGRAQLNKVIRGIPDSEIYFRHQLWAWKSCEPMRIGGEQHGMTWQKLLMEIAEHDQQRFGTADQCADQLDRFDELKEAAIQRDIDNGLDGLNDEAYIAATTLAGTRVGLTSRKPEGARSSKQRRRAYRPPSDGGGAGAIWVPDRNL